MLPELHLFSNRANSKHDSVPHYQISPFLVQSNFALLFRSPKGIEKKFEIAGLRNNRGSVKGKGKSKGIRSSFEIAGTSN